MGILTGSTATTSCKSVMKKQRRTKIAAMRVE